MGMRAGQPRDGSPHHGGLLKNAARALRFHRLRPGRARGFGEEMLFIEAAQRGFGRGNSFTTPGLYLNGLQNSVEVAADVIGATASQAFFQLAAGVESLFQQAHPRSTVRRTGFPAAVRAPL